MKVDILQLKKHVDEFKKEISELTQAKIIRTE